MKNNIKLEDDDFGFTFIDDDISALSKKNSEESKKLDEIYNIFIKFLDNLSTNPEKTTLHWPDRVEKINILKNKLKSIKERDL